MQSLYEQLGGAPAIEAVVESFYRKMLSDDRVARFFDGIDMERQMAKQTAFITMVTGGPHNYTGRDMRTAHASMLSRGLADLHVDVVIQHLCGTLAEFGVGEEQINKVRALCESVRDDVLSRDKRS
ncbi:MAG: group 1 truncated hemoglobin [Myxococcales bacterium]|jgi:hemoglobin|nr:group 1 truncated hemoglobin [Myxococcales bacterium]